MKNYNCWSLVLDYKYLIMGQGNAYFIHIQFMLFLRLRTDQGSLNVAILNLDGSCAYILGPSACMCARAGG